EHAPTSQPAGKVASSQMTQKPAVEVSKTEAATVAPRPDANPPSAKPRVTESSKAPESREPSLPVEKKKAEPASTQAKSEVKIPEAKSTPVVPAQSQQDKVAEKSTGDRVALLKDKPGDSVPDKKDLVKPVPKALEGYIIQLAFSERKSAQRWAETLQRRGYAVSVTEAGIAAPLQRFRPALR